MKRNIYLDAQKTDRLIINLAPIFFALIAFFSSLILGKRPYKEEDWTSILSSLLGMWATLLGFMITAVSVLLTFKDGAFITILKKSGHYNTDM